jgi:hypothetical protein
MPARNHVSSQHGRDDTARRTFAPALSFSDGTSREVDVDPFLHGPVFDPLRSDPQMFRAVRVDAALGTVVWPTAADLCPDVPRMAAAC